MCRFIGLSNKKYLLYLMQILTEKYIPINIYQHEPVFDFKQIVHFNWLNSYKETGVYIL